MELKPTRYGLQDIEGGKEVSIQANWNKQSSPNKYFKFIIGDEEAIINAKHLRSIIWLCSNEEERDNLIKNRITEIHKVRRTVVVQAKKDIKEGDFLSFVVDFPYDEITLYNAKHDKLRTVR